MAHKGWLALAAMLLLVCCASIAVSQQQTDTQVFTGQYNELMDQQKRLVDDWFRRFSETIEKHVDAEEGYNNLPLSVKTTFNAVTHALLRTPMTDASGASLGESAITIIDKIDSVAGKIPGAGGDEQFRIYIQLKPGMLKLLDKSQEFKRRADNTIYHKGYPVCYRSTGGTPSIQVSMTRDGSRADIDVDYRSSKFPVFLINGHLSSSNSDVEAGDNDVRHNSQWSGLRNWWQNLLGLPYIEDVGNVDSDDEGMVIPRNPAVKAKAKPEEAVYDFLNSWLVEQNPNQSIAYFAEQAYACIEVERGHKIDRGMAKYMMLTGFQDINKQIGTISDLSEAVRGVRYGGGSRGKVIQQPYHAQFVLYNIREDLATQFDCTAKLDPGSASAKAARSKDFGKYFAAFFRLKTGEETGENIVTVWTKQGGYWKLVSYDVAPSIEEYRVPDLAAKPEVPKLVTVEGDKKLIQAGRDFLEKWFVKGQPDQAFSYLSPQCYSCVNLYRDEDTPAPGTSEEAARLIRQGMDRMAVILGDTKKLKDVISAPQPSNQDIRIVKHSRSKEFVIASIPNSMAEAADCSRMERGEDLSFDEDQEKVYGDYYAIGFQMEATVEDAGVLWTVWHKEKGEWKVVSYHILTP